MNIAIVTSSFPLDAGDPAAAAGLFVRDFAVVLAQQGHDVHVLTQDKGWGCKDSPPEISVHCYPWPGGTKALSQLRLSRIRDVWSAYALLREGKKAIRDLHRDVGLDHVLAMWAVPSGIIANKLHRTDGIPFSAWCLGSDIWTYGKIPILRHVVRRVIRSAQYCFADGLQLANDAQRLSGKPITFLPSSRKLRFDSIKPAQLSGDFPKFLFVGRYAHVKGIDVLLKAMSDFRQREGRGTLYLLGGGPLESQLRQEINEAELKGHVTMGGYADATTYISHALACDAIVIPSRMESVPVVLSDAAQMGKAVIVTDVGDMGKIVTDTASGLVVPAEDPLRLSRAMSEFSQRGPAPFQKGLNELSRQFDIDRTASRFLDIISGGPILTPPEGNKTECELGS